MTKNFLQTNEHRALNEILFENRNKQYGAYALRTEANVFLTRAFFIGVSVFSLFVLTPIIISSFKAKPRVIINSGPVILDVIPETPEIVKPKDPVVVTPPQVKTAVATVPDPTSNPKKEETVSSKKEIDNSAIGFIKTEGKEPTTTIVDTKPVVPEKTVEKPKINPEVIATSVDVEADFIGGIDTFRNKVVQDFDGSNVNSDGEVVKAVVTFIVERDGSISNIKASGGNTDFNREAEKTIKNMKGKWKPAKLQGESVRSYFRFPISMQFE